MDDLATIQWIFVEGLPLILVALFWCGCLTLTVYLWRATRAPSEDALSQSQASGLQNRIYKRAGALLLGFGAAGGFLPSLFMLAKTGQVWSVNHQAPHSMVDTYLLVHIPLAVVWACLVAVQLWTGQVARYRRVHVYVGWLTLATGVVGVGVVGGWIWPLINDFADGFDSPNAGAGIYTMSMGVGVVANGLLAGYYARKRNLARHKDHALMTLFWTMDPGIHRLYMWLMRLFGGDTWAPEQTNGMGIAIAKLPANLSLIAWALVTAVLARRLNGIVWSNVVGQFALWGLGTSAVMGAAYGAQITWTMLIASAAILATVWAVGRRPTSPVLRCVTR